MSIPSVLRIPISELGENPDQTAAKAFLSVVQPGGFGIATEVGAYSVYYKSQAKGGTARLFRSPYLTGEPDRWRTIPQFQPLPPVKPQKGNWLNQWWLDLQAGALTKWNDLSRFVELPWPAGGFKLPPPADARYADFGLLIDDDLTGLSGFETLGVRVARPDEVDLMNRAAGYGPQGQSAVRQGDLICDGVGYRTPENTNLFNGRGAGPVQKRAGLVFPDDLIHGWDEAKALTLPNNQCGPGATCAPGFRVEHPLASQRPGFPYGYGNRPGITVPSGTRFYSTRPMEGPTGIKRWADDQNLTGPLRTSAINCAVGSAEFGINELETSGVAAIESVGIGFNPMHTEGFKQAGVLTGADGFRLQRGFWTPEFTKVAGYAPIDPKTGRLAVR